jgi:radical SAM protein with 4Fe4S-binding SPASM domain
MGTEQFTCRKAFCTVEVHADGRVFPCCPSWVNDYSLGNIYESDFESIWNSEKAIEFRKSIINRKYTWCNLSMCQGTSLFHSGESASTFGSPDGKASLYPEYVKFCHDKTCNLHCITCRDEVIANTAEKAEELDALIESHFLPLLKDAKTVALNGEGEFLASRHCRRLVKEITERYPQIKFALCSNGVLCDEKNCAELGILDRISSVQISVNAATQETYEKIMLGGNFNRIRQNIEWLSSLKKEGKIDALRLVFVVSSINYREMKAFMEWAIELDAIVDFWEYRPWGNTMAKDYDRYAVFDPKHREYRRFARILKDDIFKHPNCCRDGELRGVNMSKTGLRFLFSRVVKKLGR